MPGGRRRPAPLTALPPPPPPPAAARARPPRSGAAPHPPPSRLRDREVPGQRRAATRPRRPAESLCRAARGAAARRGRRLRGAAPGSSAPRRAPPPWGRGHFLFLRAAGPSPAPSESRAEAGRRAAALPGRSTDAARGWTAPPVGQGWKSLTHRPPHPPRAQRDPVPGLCSLPLRPRPGRTLPRGFWSHTVESDLGSPQ